MDKWSKTTIKPKVVINRFKELRIEFPQEVIQVDFFGGEPLLQLPMIKEIISEIKGIDDNHKFFMPTNGISLNQPILDYLKSESVKISISLDGLWQDSNRPIRDSAESSLSILLKKRHLFKGLKCHTMLDGTKFNLLENHLYIKDNFDMNPELTLVRDIGTWTPDAVKLLYHSIDEMYEWYSNNLHEEIPNFILYWVRDIIRYHAKGHVTDGCGVNRDLFALTENNEKVTCDRFAGDPEAVSKIDEYYSMSACTTCRVKNYCHKGCMYENIKNEGVIPELCDIYKYCYDKSKTLIPMIPKDIIRTEIYDS